MFEGMDAAHGDRRADEAGCGAAAPWPPELIEADPPTRGACVVRFAPVLSLEPSPAVSLFHQVAIVDAIAWQTHLHTWPFECPDEARRAADWISRHRNDAASAARIGCPAALADFGDGMRIAIFEEREQEEALEAQARRLQQEEMERATRIDSFLVDAEGQFGLDLRRPGAKAGFWRIMFRERWERERFRDWFRCQRDRFEEFAAFHDAHDALALERLVLREMLDAERQAKAAGIAAGGRRPLRFWRGE